MLFLLSVQCEIDMFQRPHVQQKIELKSQRGFAVREKRLQTTFCDNISKQSTLVLNSITFNRFKSDFFKI